MAAGYAPEYDPVGGACAAFLCLVVAGVASWGGHRMMEDAGATENAMQLESIILESARGGDSFDAHDTMEYTPSSSSAMIGGGSVTTDGMPECMPESAGKEESKVDAETSLPLGERKAITLQEACAMDTIGAYVPVEAPAGYVLESVFCMEDEPASLQLCWTRGMDSIFWSVRIAEDADRLQVVDIEREETYDESLYEIPHAETVPDEYRSILMDPVCKAEDFSLDFVEKRIIDRGVDAGDTATPRGNFSVLYPDGVLVQFNGRGSAEEIWKMFEGLSK